MFRLIHISDLHLGPLPPPRVRDLASKRILGFINWQRRRANAMDATAPTGLIAAIAAAHPDHVAVTGDLVNIALAGEFVAARAFLERLGPADRVSVVPGNHDAYVPGAARRAQQAWAPYMTADAGNADGWPYVRRRGPVAVIGVSTAVASAPFMATGTFSDGQARRLSAILQRLGDEGLCRVVLIHHPPFKGATAWYKRLTDAARFRAVIAGAGAELVLHGHTHRPTRAAIAGPGGTTVPVIGVSAATQRPGGHHPAGGYNLFDIDRSGDGWIIRHGLWQSAADRLGFQETRRELLGVPVRPEP